MLQHLPYRHFTTKLQNIRLALCVTRRYMAPTQTGCSLNRKHGGDEMNRKTNVLSTWPSRLLLVGVALFGVTLFAQAPSGQSSSSQQADKDKKPALAKKADADR